MTLCPNDGTRVSRPPRWQVNPREKFERKLFLRIENMSNVHLKLTCTSNLANQLTLHADEACRLACDSLSLEPLRTVIVIARLQPHLDEDLQSGACRVIEGGIQVKVWRQVGDVQQSAQHTVRFVAVAGLGLMKVDKTLVRLAPLETASSLLMSNSSGPASIEGSTAASGLTSVSTSVNEGFVSVASTPTTPTLTSGPTRLSERTFQVLATQPMRPATNLTEVLEARASAQSSPISSRTQLQTSSGGGSASGLSVRVQLQGSGGSVPDDDQPLLNLAASSQGESDSAVQLVRAVPLSRSGELVGSLIVTNPSQRLPLRVEVIAPSAVRVPTTRFNIDPQQKQASDSVCPICVKSVCVAFGGAGKACRIWWCRQGVSHLVVPARRWEARGSHEFLSLWS
jgi:hypothetical protein